MNSLIKDVRYGLRTLMEHPGFTAVAVIALALGIGANTAIFSVVNAVLLRPLPYDDAGQLMMVDQTNPSRGLSNFGVSMPDFRAWRERNQSFERLAAFSIRNFNISEGGDPVRVQGMLASAALFPVLRVNPVQGRAFTADEEVFGNHRVVVLSNALWRSRFGARGDIVDQAITLNDEKFTVVGIMPASFKFPDGSVDLWTPLSVEPGNEYNTRGNFWLAVIGRLRDGVTIAQARSDMTTVAEQLEREAPELAGLGARVDSLGGLLIGGVETALYILLGAVGFVLLIACTNVANLLLARSAARQKEIAIRTALGASRRRIVRQLLTESAMLGLIGGALGLLLSLWGVSALVSLNPGGLPRAGEINVDGRVLAFTAGLSLLTSLIFGLFPALQVSKLGLNDSLKEGARDSTGGMSRRRIRSAVVIAEVALSLVPLVGAGLMINSFLRLQNVNPGFRPDNVLTMQISLPPSKYPDNRPDLTFGFFQQLIDRVRVLPGVESAGVTSSLPLTNSGWGKLFTIEDRPAPTSLEDIPVVQYRQVSPDYFGALQVPLARGRYFTDQDNGGSAPLAIINESLASRYFSNEDPVGKRIKLGPPEEMIPPGLVPAGYRLPRFTIVGVVSDVKHNGLTQPVTAEVYTLHYLSKGDTDASRTMYLAIRTNNDPLSLTGAVRSQVTAIDKDQPVADVATMETLLSGSLGQPRFSALLLGIFAAVALALAAVGVYGVMACSVEQRMREIGIRIALGARAADVFKLLLGDGVTLALVGVAIGLAGAIALTRFMSGLLFGISATDPATFAVTSLILTGVALTASFVPARRATRIDPMAALRCE